MIDILYENKVKLVLQSAVPIDQVFGEVGTRRTGERGDDDGTTRQLADNLAVSYSNVADLKMGSGMEERFALDRTLSRLQEMASRTWWS